MKTISPYLNFNGNTEEVFNFYKSVFGGESAAIMRFGEMPGCDGMPIAEGDKNKIMHVALPIGDSVLMATDTLESMGQVTTGSNNFSIAAGAESREEADRIFNGLSDGGTVEMPLADAFWGDYFGMLKDRFGIQWMVSFDGKE